VISDEITTWKELERKYSEGLLNNIHMEKRSNKIVPGMQRNKNKNSEE